MKSGEQICKERGMVAFSEADYQTAHLPVSVNCLDCNRAFATNSSDIFIDDDGFWWCNHCLLPHEQSVAEIRASIISALPETTEEEKQKLLAKILEVKPGYNPTF